MSVADNVAPRKMLAKVLLSAERWMSATVPAGLPFKPQLMAALVTQIFDMDVPEGGAASV